MKKILYLNGSPREKNSSNSYQILKDIASFLEDENISYGEPDILTLPRSYIVSGDEFFEKMDSADIWILALPLYIDTLPGHLSFWLKRYEEHRKELKAEKKIKVYAFINCGFPEAVQNRDALKIMEIYCRKNRLNWRFGIGLGMGEAYKQMKGIPLRSPLKRDILKSFRTLAADIENDNESEIENMFVSVRFPSLLYRLMGTAGWIQRGRKNGLKKKNLYACPYQD